MRAPSQYVCSLDNQRTEAPSGRVSRTWRLATSISVASSEPTLKTYTVSRLSVAVLRQNSVRREVVDLPALIRRRSWFDGHPPAPAASPSALSLRRPPPARPRKPRLAPATRRLQANGAPAEATHD